MRCHGFLSASELMANPGEQVTRRQKSTIVDST